MIFLNKIVGSRIHFMSLDPNLISEKYVDWLNQPDVNRYLELRFLKNDIQSVAKFIGDLNSSLDNYFFGIYLNKCGTHIGNIKLGPIDFNHLTGTIGILIGNPNFWGMGYATESINLLKKFAFQELSLMKLNAGCYSENIGSARAFIKSGFYQEGIQKSQVIFEDVRSDVILFGLTRESFDQQS